MRTPTDRRTTSATTRGRALTLAAAGVVSAGMFLLMSRAVARRATAEIDRKVLDHIEAEPGSAVRSAAEAGAPAGKWYSYTPAAVLTGAYAVGCATRGEVRSRILGSLAMTAAAGAAAGLNKVLDDLLPQPPAPPGRPTPDHPVFPSGHAMGTMAVALTAAYVLSREELARPAIVYPVAVALPLASSIGRMLEAKHWISDVIGGYFAAAAIAFLPLAAYEALRPADCDTST